MSFYFPGPNRNPWINPESEEARSLPANGTHGAVLARNTAIVQASVGSTANFCELHPVFRLAGQHLRLEIDVPLNPTIPPYHPDYGVQVAAFQHLAQDLQKVHIDISALIDNALTRAKRQMEAALAMLNNNTGVNLSDVSTTSTRGRSTSKKSGAGQKKPVQTKPRSQSEGAQKKQPAQGEKPAGNRKTKKPRSPSANREDKFKPQKGYANYKTKTGTHIEYPTLAAETCCGVKPSQFTSEPPASITPELEKHYQDIVAYHNAFVNKFNQAYFAGDHEYTVTNEDGSTVKVKGKAPTDIELADEAVKVLQSAHDTMSEMNTPLQQVGATETWQFIKHQLIKCNYLLSLAYKKRAILKTVNRRAKSQTRADKKKQEAQQQQTGSDQASAPATPAEPRTCVVCGKKPCMCDST